LVPIVAVAQDRYGTLQVGSTDRQSGSRNALFFALPATESSDSPREDRSPAVVPLYEYEREGGERIYSTRADLPELNLKRRSEPMCRVWKNQMTALVLDAGTRPIVAERR
jgi:hypothetical protein